MNWQPSAGIAALRLRANLYALIRQFFSARAVLEVETPILSQAGNTDQHIESFRTHFSGHVDAGSAERWLRTSPEYPLKRLLAAGIGDCYELGRVFRNGEAGHQHNPEFTMLEWYRVGWNHRRLMQETAELVRTALAMVDRSVRVREVTYRDLFIETIGIDPLACDEAVLREGLTGFEIDPVSLLRDDWLDLLLTHRIQSTFACDELLMVYDYPASQCALARIRNDDPPVAERFELYLGSVELANGYHELTDATEQRGRFERDHSSRMQCRNALPSIDERLLAALQHGLPDCAGVALGVDRLLSAMLETSAIAATITFPFDRA
ncbi:MAG: EF-P lysine aminoacylase EpmA [Lysobacteraceae bacterium]